MLKEYGLHIGLVLAPFFISIALSVILVNIAQFGLRFTTHPIKPKFEKLNLFANWKRVLISVNSIVPGSNR